MPDIASEFYAAIHYAAGVVHAKMSAVEADYNNWSTSNPELSPIIDEAVQIGKSMLKSRGVDPDKLENAAEQMLTVAKQVGAAIAVTAPPPVPVSPLEAAMGKVEVATHPMVAVPSSPVEVHPDAQVSAVSIA